MNAGFLCFCIAAETNAQNGESTWLQKTYDDYDWVEEINQSQIESLQAPRPVLRQFYQ
jgi:hypothetical protein